MSKKKTLKRTIALTPAEAHAVLTSDEYLLRVDPPKDGSDVRIVESDIQRPEEGGVTATLNVEMTPAPKDGKPGEPMQIQQSTEVLPFQDGTCNAVSTLPLPQGMGQMQMKFAYTAKKDPAAGSDVRIEVIVDVAVPVPMIGGMIERKILGDADKTVDQGLSRIEAQGLELRAEKD